MFLTLALAALVTSAPAQKIAILELESTGVDRSVAETVSLLIPTEVRSRVPGAQVIASGEIRAMLGFERQRQLVGCHEDSGCVAEIGDALGADEILSGKLGRIDQTLVLELRRIDVRRSRSLGSVTRVVKGSAAALVDVIPQAIATLFHSTETTDGPSGVVGHAAGAGAHPWGGWVTAAGGVLLVGGIVGTLYGLNVAGQVAAQQPGGARAGDPTVTRSGARTASVLYTVGVVGGAVGAAGVALGLWGALTPTSPTLSVAPIPGGAAATFGGRF